jgi:photosynthetic reaction center cytochrome c subunit
MMRGFRFRSLILSVAALAVLAGCERPPIESVQGGYRGTGMQQVYNQRLLVTQASLNTAPEPAAAASADGPKAKDVYQNVKVLGELSVGEFARNMVSITQWVAPKEGCTYCHNAANFADDSKYTKVVARRMLQMTQHVNADWKSHVGATGVTCYTCHRGNPVPNQVWFAPADRRSTGALLGDLEGQNQPAASVAYSSLPFDPLTPYLLEAKPIRVNGNEALAMTGNAANRNSTKQAEFTYGLMMHMSQSLGVNCTYCHNTQSFQSWEVSPPTRATAWYGIRMARDLNNDYMTPLTATFPANRLGPKGDVAKVACGTCHQGAFKPLYGAEMAKHHRELQGPLPVTMAAAGAAGSASGAASTASDASATGTSSAAGAAAAPAAASTSAAPAAPAAGATDDNKVVGATN